MPATNPPAVPHRDDSGFDAYAAAAAAARRGRERTRTRRGGPRAPWPLLPLIGLGAGVGIAYVSQSAHVTQSTYVESSLTAKQAELRQVDDRLGGELDRLRSPERIAAAAQSLGMRPPQRWAFVATVPPPVAAPSPSGPSATQSPQPSSPLQHVVEAMRGSYGGDSAP